MSSRVIEYRPPRIAAALLLVAATFHLLAPIHLFASLIVGVALGTTGFSVMMWAWWQFQQNEVAVCPTEVTERLITDGVYRFTRNPMCLGMLMILAGIAAFVGTLPFYIAVIALFTIIDRSFCPYEENKLASAFGRDYKTYKSQVRRWI